MVKLEPYSGGSDDESPTGNASCSTAASSNIAEMNGNSLKSHKNFTNKMSTKKTPFMNGSCTNEENLLVNGKYKNKSINGISTVNGHSDKLSSNVSRMNGNSTDKVLLNDEHPAKVPMVNGHCHNKNSDNHLNGSSVPTENDSSNVHKSDSLFNSDENQLGFTTVVNKKRNKKKEKNHYKNQSSNLPPGLNTASIRRDNGIDKNSGKKTSSPIHVSHKPPSRNFAAITSSEKSYSSALANGQSGHSRPRNGVPNVSTVPHNVSKVNKLSSNFTLQGTCNLADQLSAELTKSAIQDSTAVSCKQNNLPAKVEMTDVSAQTDVSSKNNITLSQKECLSCHEVIHEPEKASTPSDYVDVGEISDGSSNAVYCDSVDSNDSGRGDSETTYDWKRPYCFEFPREKTSQLIGRSGSFKYEIEKKSGVKLHVMNPDWDQNLSIVHMSGTGAQIEQAKEIIKARFRHVPLTQWLGFQQKRPALSEFYIQYLPVGVSLMSVVSCICDPSFFWVQQLGHPNYFAIHDLERKMSEHFNNVTDAPRVDDPTLGSVVAVPGVRDGNNAKWIRGLIVGILPEGDTAVVRYLDHGGDHLVPIDQIRPMRHSFFTVPFYATQCSLSDILPAGEVWSEEARAEFTRLCNGTSPPIVRAVAIDSDFCYVSMSGYINELNVYVDVAAHLIANGFGVRPPLQATQFHQLTHP